MWFLGDDWAEDHHDVELQDQDGKRLCRARLPEGVAGMARLHELVAEQCGGLDDAAADVVVGIETDRGPWVAALVAAGYQVYAINPLQVARYRQRHRVSGAKSDVGDAHALADLVRTDRHQLRPVAGDSVSAQAVRVVARAHKTMIWERSRHMLRLRTVLREFFSTALAAFGDLAAPDTLALLAAAPDPATAAALSIEQVAAALSAAGRHHIAAKAERIVEALAVPCLPLPAAVVEACVAVVRAQIGMLTAVNAQITALEQQVSAHFMAHPQAPIYLSQPGVGTVLGARQLAEFGDDPTRYHDAKARKNYAATSPITRQSGKKKTVHHRFVHNDRLVDALNRQAFCALQRSPGARRYYDALRARGIGASAALHQLANRLVGILHGCLKTNTTYCEEIAWPIPATT